MIALAEVDSRTRYTVFVNPEDRRLLSGPLPDNFEIAGRCLRPRPVRLLFQQLLLPAWRSAVPRRGPLAVVHHADAAEPARATCSRSTT